MKIFNLVLLLSTLLFIGCELEEDKEKESLTSCEAKETIQIDLGSTDISNDFNVVGVVAISTVTESNCESLATVGDMYADTLQSIIRSNLTLSLTDSEGSQIDFGINGVTLTYPDFSLEVENCKIYLKGSGLLNLSQNEIFINITSGFEGEGCETDSSFRASFF